VTDHRIFVTGTDTEVGKTLVSGILAKTWGAHYWKPVQAGTEPTTDSRTIAGWIGAERVLPEGCVLTQPASPNQAAAREGRTVPFDALRLPGVAGPLVVEGAGGLLVPLDETHSMIDLIGRLGLPALLVARSGLGTLNHTLLSIEALRRRSIPIAGVVMNGPAHDANRRDIEHFGHVRVVGTLPGLEPIRPETFETVARDWDLTV